MARYKGPCVDCGCWVERNIRSGRAKRCVPCALEAMTEQQASYADGTNPALAKSFEAGEATARALAAREGPIYERWQANVRRDLEAKATTQGETSDTFPA